MKKTMRGFLMAGALMAAGTTGAMAEEGEAKLAGGGLSLQYLNAQVGEGNMQGGRAFQYIPGGWLRFGGMGLRGTLEGDDAQARSLSYGGFTAEAVFRPSRRLEIPVGVLLGAGGMDAKEGGKETLVIVGPMAAIEFNPLPWMKVGASVTSTLGFGTKHGQSLQGLSTGVHIAFGRFDPAY